MASRLNPYLTFNGNAREAMTFYHSILGGELTITTFGQTGESDPAIADLVMHAMIKNDKGYWLMASDTMPGSPFNPGNTVTVSLSGDAGEGLEEAWEKLSEGGEIHVPFEKQPWGDLFGQCADRYGVQWMVDVAPA